MAATTPEAFRQFLNVPVTHESHDETDSDDAGVSLLVNDDEDDQDEEGWKDVEEDEQDEGADQVATCPICEKEFLGSKVVFGHLAGEEETGEGHGFDVGKYARKNKLDFYGTIKLVNYLRTVKTVEALRREDKPDELFLKEDKYLQPVLDDDPLLYTLGDLLENCQEDEDGEEGWTEKKDQDGTGKETAEKKAKRLEEQLSRITAEFEEYKNYVQQVFEKALENRIADDQQVSNSAESSKRKERVGEQGKKEKKAEDERDIDEHYFRSYAGNDIHETMLKDGVRTDSYRDFIYHNKHLFKGRVILDIGCGTGILSMFCARAGAKKVYAVDNSAIIEKARLIIFENSLQDVITCIKGKIEEVTLPVKQVDIIISEWMGYCLLYEAMLDSVIFARDKYLKPGGLMVPSHTTLLISPLHSHEIVNDHINFWNQVYGFKMNSMKQGICEDIIVDTFSKEDLASEQAAVFKVLDLYDVTVEGLSFIAPFEVEITKDFEEAYPLKHIEEEEQTEEEGLQSELTSSVGNAAVGVHGFLLWFDIFFTTNRSQKITSADRAETWKLKMSEPDPGVGVSFTTGPFGKETHWKQGALLVDTAEKKRSEKAEEEKSVTFDQLLRNGDKVKGSVTYRKRKENNRELEIEVEWKVVKDRVEGNPKRQMWFMK